MACARLPKKPSIRQRSTIVAASFSSPAPFLFAFDGRRDIANAILADQSGADHGEAARGQQPTWLLPRAVRERMGPRLR